MGMVRYMILHRRDMPLLGFLNLINQSNLPKKILDCGAGGSTPPLRIFHEHGYECYGIEILKEQVAKAAEYSKNNNIKLDIIEGDMLELPYDTSSFSFVYSHHTVFHMVKVDIKRAIDQMKRVLVPGGLMFVNFPLMDRADRMEGKKVGKGEYESVHGDESVIHSYFEDDEADDFFEGMQIVHKMKYNLLKSEEWVDGIAMIEYILRKV